MTNLNVSIPIANQPNATEDPKIITSLTNLNTWAAGNIDGVNIAVSAAFLALKPVAVGSNTSATTGNLYRVTGTTTITLPVHAAGQVVGITNVSGATTVAGTAIQGLGLSSATSYTLAAPGATTLLVDDGANWNIVAGGQQDTGWVTLSLNGGFTAQAGFYAPAYRLQGDTVRLRGVINAASTGTITTLPSSTFPASKILSPTGLITITSAGVMSTTSASAGQTLDGLQWTLT